MSYDEEEDVISDSGFNPNMDESDFDDESFDEPLDETEGFKFDEEDQEEESM